MAERRAGAGRRSNGGVASGSVMIGAAATFAILSTALSFLPDNAPDRDTVATVSILRGTAP